MIRKSFIFMFLYAAIWLASGCAHEKPGFMEGDYLGSIMVDGDTSEFFMTIRLGDVEKDAAFEAPGGVLLRETDIWEVKGQITGAGFYSEKISGKYVNDWQIPFFLGTGISGNRQLSMNGAFDGSSIEIIQGTCILSFYENNEIIRTSQGNFRVEK